MGPLIHIHVGTLKDVLLFAVQSLCWKSEGEFFSMDKASPIWGNNLSGVCP